MHAKVILFSLFMCGFYCASETNTALRDLKTKDGKVYQDVTVLRTNTASLTLRHKTGIATIPLDLLPESLYASIIVPTNALVIEKNIPLDVIQKFDGRRETMDLKVWDKSKAERNNMAGKFLEKIKNDQRISFMEKPPCFDGNELNLFVNKTWFLLPRDEREKLLIDFYKAWKPICSSGNTQRSCWISLTHLNSEWNEFHVAVAADSIRKDKVVIWAGKDPIK